MTDVVRRTRARTLAHESTAPAAGAAPARRHLRRRDGWRCAREHRDQHPHGMSTPWSVATPGSAGIARDAPFGHETRPGRLGRRAGDPARRAPSAASSSTVGRGSRTPRAAMISVSPATCRRTAAERRRRRPGTSTSYRTGSDASTRLLAALCRRFARSAPTRSSATVTAAIATSSLSSITRSSSSPLRSASIRNVVSKRSRVTLGRRSR